MSDNTKNQEQPQTYSPEQQKRGRRMFLLMFALFFGPFLMAALAKYYGWFTVSDTVNYGSLITPAVQLSELPLQVTNKDNKQVSLREKWSLLIFIPENCEDACVKSVREIEAIHLLLNRDIQRVQLLAIDNMDMEAGLYRNDLEANANLQTLQQEFITVGQSLSGYYLVDPKGFLILSYPQELDAKKVQKDLKRLLKYSRIG